MASALSFKRRTDAAPASTPPPAQTQSPAPTTAQNLTPVQPPSAPVEHTLAAAQEPPKSAAPAVPSNPVNPTPVNPTSNTAASTALVAPTGTQIVSDDFYQGVGGFEGEWNAGDMATPYLSIVGKTSKAFDTHPDWMGQWLYDKEYPLGTEIRGVFIRATKWFVEDLPFGSQQIPQRFARMADARAAGFNESTLKDLAELDLLIEVPADIEGVSDLAHIIVGDKGYILARYTVQSTAYGKTASILAKDMSGFLKGNLINGFYIMTTMQKTGQKGTYYVPVLKTDGKTSDELKAQIIERMSFKAAA